MQDLIMTVGMLFLKGVAVPLIGLFLAWASIRLPAWIKTKVKNARIEGVLERTASLAMSVVQEVDQTVVSKLGDKLDATTLAAARDQALATLKSHLGDKGLQEVEAALGLENQDAVIKLLITLIEQAVNTLKMSKASVATVVPVRAPQAGFVRPVFLFVMCGLMAVSIILGLSCVSPECKPPENANSLKCTVENVAVDCGKDVEPAVLTQVGTVFENVVLDNTSADGSVDWGNVWRLFGGLSKSYGMCLISNLIDNYAAAPPKLASGEVRPDVNELKRGLAAAKVAYHLAPADKVKTARSIHQ